MIIDIILFIIIIFFSITFHECSHGWMAYKLGDPTPKLSGRLTLNPFAHIDPFGTIVLPIILAMIGVVPFGYAKPVPINPYHFKNPRKDIMWVGISGPASNFILAFVLSLILRITGGGFIPNVLVWAITINIVLAVFNIMPIPPLDGSRVLASFLPHKISYNYLKLGIWGFVFIILLINLGFFKWFIIPAIRIVFSIFGIENYSPV